LPTPEEAKVSLPGSAFARAISSCTLLAGKSGPTIRICGVAATGASGTKVPLGAVRQVRNRGGALIARPFFAQKAGVAVPRRFGRGLGGDVAGRAAAVLHDDGLFSSARPAVRHHAPDDVGRASRRNTRSAAGARAWPVLLRDCRQRKRESEKRDDAANLHGRLLHRCANIFFPGTGISAVTISPFSESVMWSTLRFAPP